MEKHRFPGFGQCDAAAAAVEQGRPRLCLQLFDVPRDGGLGDEEFAGGTGETAVTGDADECFQSEVHSSLFASLWVQRS